MIFRKKEKEYSWHPAKFKDYLAYYPNTPHPLNIKNDLTNQFISKWDEVEQGGSEQILSIKKEVTVVMVKGIYGNYYYGNMKGISDYLNSKGIKTLFPKLDYASGIQANQEMLYQELKDIPGELIVLAHSKGGLDILSSISSYPDLEEKIMVVGIAQTTNNDSVIFDSILNGSYRSTLPNQLHYLKERFFNVALKLSNHHRGAKDLVGERLKSFTSKIQSHSFKCRIYSVATWSLTPTSLLDSYHQRLGEIRPQCAHDGQFYIENQLWDFDGQIILGNIDHSQLVMGGNGLNEVLFWRIFLDLLLDGSNN